MPVEVDLSKLKFYQYHSANAESSGVPSKKSSGATTSLAQY